ncbi:MAG: PD-(D/E)XK nuclease family protein [Anaerolineae bacterium]|nr:PD-(D/E)XK nuclease family protein [Anaerolineae bacterium]
MPLPSDFQFSQSSLQNYVSCPRRFELLYILKINYPAPVSEPVLEYEQHIERGRIFHQMVHQHLIGLPPDTLSSMELDPILSEWWQNYLKAAPTTQMPLKRCAEFSLSTTLSGWRVTARYDLLAVEPRNKAIIVDWKTSITRPKADVLKTRIQTRLYPLILVEAGKTLNEGYPFAPEQIELQYWYPAFPNHPQHFRYGPEQYTKDRGYIQNLIAEIANTPENGFPLTSNTKLCQFCMYRSLCKRGSTAGDWTEMQSSYEAEDFSVPEFQLDFEQLQEIEF